LNLIKENHGLNENDVIADNMIPTTFNEETEFLSDNNIEDSMSHDSLIGSTISTRSKKNISCASEISSPSVLSHDTKTSKVSEKDNPHDFYLKNFNHKFLQFYPILTLKDTGTMLRRNLKKIRIM
jgi:hypothetical protein